MPGGGGTGDGGEPARHRINVEPLPRFRHPLIFFVLWGRRALTLRPGYAKACGPRRKDPRANRPLPAGRLGRRQNATGAVASWIQLQSSSLAKQTNGRAEVGGAGPVVREHHQRNTL